MMALPFQQAVTVTSPDNKETNKAYFSPFSESCERVGRVRLSAADTSRRMSVILHTHSPNLNPERTLESHPSGCSLLFRVSDARSAAVTRDDAPPAGHATDPGVREAHFVRRNALTTSQGREATTRAGFTSSGFLLASLIVVVTMEAQQRCHPGAGGGGYD